MVQQPPPRDRHPPRITAPAVPHTPLCAPHATLPSSPTPIPWALTSVVAGGLNPMRVPSSSCLHFALGPGDRQHHGLIAQSSPPNSHVRAPTLACSPPPHTPPHPIQPSAAPCPNTPPTPLSQLLHIHPPQLPDPHPSPSTPHAPRSPAPHSQGVGTCQGQGPGQAEDSSGDPHGVCCAWGFCHPRPYIGAGGAVAQPALPHCSTRSAPRNFQPCGGGGTHNSAGGPPCHQPSTWQGQHREPQWRVGGDGNGAHTPLGVTAGPWPPTWQRWGWG